MNPSRTFKQLMWAFTSLMFALVFALVSTPAAFGSPADERGPTFSKDIAPIFQKSCQSCHHPGSIAPMSLVTYQDVRP